MTDSWEIDLDEILDRTEAYVLKHDYRGWDPYDGLMAPYWNWPILSSNRRLRWFWQQLVKRTPLNIRPLLGIQPGLNPVTLALCAQGYAYRDLSNDALTRQSKIGGIVQELTNLVSPGWSGACWGYDFAWESRFATRQPYFPTVVATGFVTNALWEINKVWDLQESRQLICGAARFVKNDLNRTYTPEGFCWSYSPGDDRAVLNAAMKGARICAQAHALGAGSEYADLARRTARFVVKHQRRDGSWPYSINDDRSWVDHFHTCYVLDSLDDVIELLDCSDLIVARERGLEFYRGNFFEKDVVPRYYAGRTYPVDSTACAQAILTLVRFGEIERALGVAKWYVSHFAKSDGAFYYQLNRRWKNRQVFMRWSVAWVYLALARLRAAL